MKKFSYLSYISTLIKENFDESLILVDKKDRELSRP
jgi:hypothetical protein